MNGTLVVGIELGGTKVVVAGSRHGRELIGRTRIDTVDPTTTLSNVREAITAIGGADTVAAIGIGTFGPVDLRPASPSRGTIVDTPKPDWSGVDVLGALRPDPSVRVAVDTDVGAALVGEVRWGAARTPTAAYLTVGTGIGGSIWDDGHLVHGMNHPEIGHVPVARAEGDTFTGACPYHGACLEGMAAGPALEQRFGKRPEALDGTDRDRAIDLAAHYLAQGIRALASVIPVETVVVGGGVAHLPGFHRSVAHELSSSAGGYPPVPFGDGGPAIVAPGLGDDAGVVGAIELARTAAAQNGTRS